MFENGAAKLSPESTNYSKPPPINALIPEKLAAIQIGISKMTLKRLRDAGKIEFYRIGGRVFYDSEMILKFIDSCRRG